MARILVTADWHINSNRLERGFGLARSVMATALLHQITHVFVVGDLLDEKERYSLDLLAGLAGIFEEYADAGLDLYWIRGNHEVPLSSRPTHTIMKVFRNLCWTVDTASVVEVGDDLSVFCLPWYPAEMFKERSKNLAHKTTTHKGRAHLLLAHVGLSEGELEGGFRIEQPIQLCDLHCDNYHQVWLGDYHKHQKVGPRAYYCGVPISHRHGEENPNRVWVFDSVLRRAEPVDLAVKFPGHVTYTIESRDDLPRDFDPNQINKIKCHVNDVAELRKRFGREVVYETHGSSLPEVARRVTDQSSYEHVLGEFLKSKGWEKTHSAEAMKYLKKVKGKMK